MTVSIIKQSAGNSTNYSDFAKFWIQLASFDPIILTVNGWSTVKAKSGKPVPLQEPEVRRHMEKVGGATIIGKRFGKLTNYAMIDLDKLSELHPTLGKPELFQLLLVAMEAIGLCRYVVVRSSDSGGVHVYFPFPEAVGTWAIAQAMDSTVKAHGLTVAKGQLELFPNIKKYGSLYNGHRLPLQAGSYILDDDFQVIGNRPADLMSLFAAAAAGQDMETLREKLAQGKGFGTAVVQPKERAEIAHDAPVNLEFTAFGQANQIIGEIGKEGARRGIRGLRKLGDWIDGRMKALPGYNQFTSRATKRDKNWAYRIAKWALRGVGGFKRQGNPNHNQEVQKDAIARMDASIDQAIATEGFDRLPRRRQFGQINEISMNLFGRGFSFRTLNKYKFRLFKKIQKFRFGLVLLKSVDGAGGVTHSNTLMVGNAPTPKGFSPLPTPQKPPENKPIFQLENA